MKAQNAQKPVFYTKEGIPVRITPSRGNGKSRLLFKIYEDLMKNGFKYWPGSDAGRRHS